MLLLGSRAGMFLASTVCVIALTRILGPAQYGIYAAAVAITTAVQAFGFMGLDQLYLRGDVDEAELRTASMHVALLQIVLVAVAAAGWPNLSMTARVCTVAMGIGQATIAMRLPWYYTPQRRLQFAVRARREVAAFALTQLAVVAVVVIGQGVLAAGLAAMVAGLFLVAVSRAQVGPRAVWSLRKSWQLLRAGSPFVFSTAFYTLYMEVDVALLAALTVPAVVAQYSVAYTFVTAAAVLPIALNADVLRPHLYRTSTPTARRRLLRDFAWLTVGLGVTAGLVVYLFGPLATHVLYGRRYDAAGALVIILAIALPFHYLNSWAANLLVGVRRLREVVTVQAVLAAANIACNLGLIPALGARGAAIATVGTESVGVGLYVACLLRRRGKLLNVDERC
jgi:O-antigen/teichoic acid export membrane protein